MLEKHLETLCAELDLSFPKQEKDKGYTFILNDRISTKLHDLDPGIAINAPLCRTPNKEKEDLFIYLMRANLLGQGTGGCRIGLDGEKGLTLSLGLPYEMNYTLFKERFEDFVNYVIYWRNEIEKFEQEGLKPK